MAPAAAAMGGGADEPAAAAATAAAPKAEAERPRLTHATHTLRDVDDVLAFLDALASTPPVAS